MRWPDRARPAPLTDTERTSVGQVARNLPRLWNATTTTQCDRKELLRALITEVVVTIDRSEHRAGVEVFWEGGARTALQVRLTRRDNGPRRLAEDTIDLIRRLAAHHPDEQIAAILNRQGLADRTRPAVHPRGGAERRGLDTLPVPGPAGQLVLTRR